MITHTTAGIRRGRSIRTGPFLASLPRPDPNGGAIYVYARGSSASPLREALAEMTGESPKEEFDDFSLGRIDLAVDDARTFERIEGGMPDDVRERIEERESYPEISVIREIRSTWEGGLCAPDSLGQ